MALGKLTNRAGASVLTEIERREDGQASDSPQISGVLLHTQSAFVVARSLPLCFRHLDARSCHPFCDGGAASRSCGTDQPAFGYEDCDEFRVLDTDVRTGRPAMWLGAKNYCILVNGDMPNIKPLERIRHLRENPMLSRLFSW